MLEEEKKRRGAGEEREPKKQRIEAEPKCASSPRSSASKAEAKRVEEVLLSSYDNDSTALAPEGRTSYDHRCTPGPGKA